jgi:hypothetical protein
LAQLFYDTGSGFSEQRSLRRAVSTGEQRLEFDLSGVGEIRELRLDPLDRQALVRLGSVEIKAANGSGIAVPDIKSNATFVDGDAYVFESPDPQMQLRLDRPAALSTVSIQLNCLFADMQSMQALSGLLGRKRRSAVRRMVKTIFGGT